MSAVVMALAVASLSISAQQYEVIDLGTLGGRSASGSAMSEGGIVAGWAQRSSSARAAVLWEHNGIRELGPPPQSATGVNDLAHACGVHEASPQAYASYFWDGDSWIPIGGLPGMTDTVAEAMDARDRIVGRSFVLGGSVPGRAFLWEAGVMTDLGTLGGSSSARGINEFGQVVGDSYIDLPGGGTEQRGFLWEDGRMTALEPLPGDTGSGASDINESGQICGWSSHASPPYFIRVNTPVVWDGGAVVDLGSVFGFSRGSASAINNRGQVVGSLAATSSGPHIAFFWQNGVMQDLNDLIPHDSGWTLTGAGDINDAGQITARGFHSSDPEALRALLLQPLIPCTADSECVDEDFCDGVESCVDGICRDGADPCPGLLCDEAADECEPASCDFDGTCELGENCESCTSDCVSNDGSQMCGDGICQPSIGEDCLSCASDCNGQQKGSPSRRFCCGADLGCSDARCNADAWICDDTLPRSYCCGDGLCEPGEHPCNCPADCGAAPFFELDCDDGVDNDCDGGADDRDSDCCGQPGDACLADMDCCSGNCKKSSKFPFSGTCR